MDCLYSLMRTKCWGHWQVGRAGHRELSQDHEIGLITKGWEAVKLHGGKWGELQVEGLRWSGLAGIMESYPGHKTSRSVLPDVLVK